MSYNSKYTGTEVEELLDSIGDKVDKVDGKQLSTEDFTTLLKQKLEGLSNYDDTFVLLAIGELRGDLDSLVSGDTTTAIKTFNEIIAFLDGIEDSQSLDSIIASIEQQIAAKYTKPSTGIPKSDLASAVQTSLGKADTALQSYTEQYKGTVSSVKINGSTKTPDSNGLVDLGTIEGGGDYLPLTGGTINGDVEITSGNGFGNLSVAGEIRGKHKGRWIPTDGKYELKGSSDGFIIYDTSGDERAGNLIFNGDGTKFLANDGTYKTISGGGSSSGSSAYPLVEHGTSDTTFTLTPNTFHVWDEVASLDLSLGAETSGVANEYLFQFTSGSTATALSLPADIQWYKGEAPAIEANMVYQISIINNLGVWGAFPSAS